MKSVCVNVVKVIIQLILFLTVGFLLIFLSLKNNNKDYSSLSDKAVSIYVNNKRVDALDSNKEYILNNYSCTNDGTLSYDEDTKKITLSVKETSCKAYFNVKLTLYNAVAEQTLGTGSNLNSGSGIDYTNPSSETNGRGVYTYTHDSTKGTIDSETGTKTIYYFRGNVTNNNVLFAGYCWLIVRTTDTGGVKLLYNGTPVSNTCPSYRTTESSFPFISASTSWGQTPLYSETSVKSTVDAWISTNLSSYSSKLETINWCNDADGQQKRGADTYSAGIRSNNGTPQLECTYDSDKYPLTGALLTVDEAMLAGQIVDNGLESCSDSFISIYYDMPVWFLLSINGYDGGIYYIQATFIGGIESVEHMDNQVEVRPSISLNSSVKVTGGDGSISNPYTVE